MSYAPPSAATQARLQALDDATLLQQHQRLWKGCQLMRQRLEWFREELRRRGVLPPVKPKRKEGRKRVANA